MQEVNGSRPLSSTTLNPRLQRIAGFFVPLTGDDFEALGGLVRGFSLVILWPTSFPYSAEQNSETCAISWEHLASRTLASRAINRIAEMRTAAEFNNHGFLRHRSGQRCEGIANPGRPFRYG